MTHFEHRVRERAYYIWEAEGRVFGRAEEHWLRAETEFHAQSPAEPVLIQAGAPALTLAPSPAEVLGETLKAKPSRTRAVAAKVDAKAKPAAEASTAKPQKPAAKVASAKPAAAKTTDAKTPDAKTTDAKPVASKPVAAKPSATKAAKAPQATARGRAAESAAMVH